MGMCKSSTFATAIERDTRKLEMVKIKMRLETHFKKNFLKKTLKKFGGFKNSPYLCIRFLNESYKEEFFERFRYEQASSTRLLILI